MMETRQYNDDLLDSQEKLRGLLLTSLYDFDISNTCSTLKNEEEIKSLLLKLVTDTKGTRDGNYFKIYSQIIHSLFCLIKWGDKELKAEDGASQRKASFANLKLINFEKLNYISNFKTNLFDLSELILKVKEVNEISSVIDRFLKIPFPTIFKFETSRFPVSRIYESNETENDQDQDAIVLSIQFTINGEPWANPQILKPEEIYSIKGHLSLNKWPDNYDTLKLKPISTSDDSWYTLSLPEIKRENKKEYDIVGNVIFKYPQSTVATPISIRLLGYFSNSTSKVEYPTIIGYDQLVLKVLDPNSVYFPTGFEIMDRLVFEISIEIDNKIPNISKTDKENFLKLLRGILNYQGFCSQQGTYKNINSLPEDQFRDKLIQHLIGLPYLGENISKEANLAGGRIEIGYKGIIAELKVEKRISDRGKLYEQYGKQPIAYAAGNLKQLSILCILDLTEKKLPPAPPQNNTILLNAKVHGFDQDEIDYPSKLAMIIIDGNTKNPSAYSK